MIQRNCLFNADVLKLLQCYFESSLQKIFMIKLDLCRSISSQSFSSSFKYMNISLRWSYKTTVKKDLTRTILLKRRRLKSYIILCISKVLILYFSSVTNLCIIFLINASLCPQNSPNVPSIIIKIVKFQILSLDRRR